MNTKSKITSEDDLVEVANDYCGHFEICEIHGTGDHPVIDVFDANALIRFKEGPSGWPEIRASELRDRELVNVAAGQGGRAAKLEFVLGRLVEALSNASPSARSVTVELAEAKKVLDSGEEEPEEIPSPEEFLPEGEIEPAKEFVRNLHQLLLRSGAEMTDPSQMEGLYLGDDLIDWLVTEASSEKVEMIGHWWFDDDHYDGAEIVCTVTATRPEDGRTYATQLQTKAERYR